MNTRRSIRRWHHHRGKTTVAPTVSSSAIKHDINKHVYVGGYVQSCERKAKPKQYTASIAQGAGTVHACTQGPFQKAKTMQRCRGRHVGAIAVLLCFSLSRDSCSVGGENFQLYKSDKACGTTCIEAAVLQQTSHGVYATLTEKSATEAHLPVTCMIMGTIMIICPWRGPSPMRCCMAYHVIHAPVMGGLKIPMVRNLNRTMKMIRMRTRPPPL